LVDEVVLANDGRPPGSDPWAYPVPPLDLESPLVIGVERKTGGIQRYEAEADEGRRKTMPV